MFRFQSPTWIVRALLAAAALAVSVAQLHAQDSSAKVLVQVGQVSILRGTGDMVTLSVGQSIQTQQVIVTGPESYARFQISDGSTFEVFANSKVVFRQTPGNWQHLLNVYIGRVKVFIQHLPGIANPNNVTSPTAVISVRGTVFDVEVEDDEGTTVVRVDDGVVDVRNLTAPGNATTLRGGNSIRVLRNVPLAARQIDKGAIWQRVVYAGRDVLVQRPGGLGGSRGPGPGSGGGGTTSPGPTGGAQGDDGKTTTGGGTSAPGTPPSAPGNPPSAPSKPPGPPGGA